MTTAVVIVVISVVIVAANAAAVARVDGQRGSAAPTTVEPREYRSYLSVLLLLFEPVSKNSDDMGYS